MLCYLKSLMTFFKTGGNDYFPIGGVFLYFFYMTAVIVGTTQLISFLYGLYLFVNKHIFRKRHDLLQRYAGGQTGQAWAVVTGASDGIGAAFCEELARIGFNIALVSRTLSKLETVEKLCKLANPKIKTRIVQADFSNTNRPKEKDVLGFYEDLKKKLEDLDIAILVNNAGVMHTGPFSAAGPAYLKWKDTIDVDVLHLPMMNSLFQDKLL